MRYLYVDMFVIHFSLNLKHHINNLLSVTTSVGIQYVLLNKSCDNAFVK